MFHPAIRPQIKAEERKKNYVSTYLNARSVIEDHILEWENGHVESRIQYLSQEAMADRVRYVYPLLDRRLVEFSFSMPAHFMFDRGYDRFLNRKAIEDLLPETVLWGRHKDERERIKQMKNFFFTMKDRLLREELYREKLQKSPYILHAEMEQDNHKITTITAILCSNYL